MIGNPVTIPAIALSHLSQKTRDWLSENQGNHPFFYAEHDNGFFLTVPLEHHLEGCPPDLATLAKAYHKDGYPTFGWIMLDVDGDVVPDLPTYD